MPWYRTIEARVFLSFPLLAACFNHKVTHEEVITVSLTQLPYGGSWHEKISFYFLCKYNINVEKDKQTTTYSIIRRTHQHLNLSSVKKRKQSQIVICLVKVVLNWLIYISQQENGEETISILILRKCIWKNK